MWLRNYYNLLSALILTDDELSSTTPPTAYTPPIMIKTTTGANMEAGFNKASFCRSNKSNLANFFLIGKGNAGINDQSGSTYDFDIRLGTGSTPVTYDDYCLESQISLTLVSSSGSLTTPTEITGDTTNSVKQYTLNNSTGSSVTVTEIGISIQVGASQVLLYREVLNTPVTLAPSESIILSFTRSGEIYNYTPYN